MLGSYFNERFGLDFRSLRYPGVLSKIMPSGGTTDYTSEMINDFANNRNSTSYVGKYICLPYIYVDDLVTETIKYNEHD